MKALIRALAPLLREARLAGLYWARREINPLHDDLPDIVRRIAHLEAQRGAA